MNVSVKIISLWGIILFGLTAHSLIELMPLFFGESIAMPGATGLMPESIGWMCLLFYLIPMISITVVLYLSSAWVKITNLFLSVIFTLFNLFHLFSDGLSSANAIQPILLTFVLFCSILLFIASLRWKKDEQTK